MRLVAILKVDLSHDPIHRSCRLYITYVMNYWTLLWVEVKDPDV